MPANLVEALATVLGPVEREVGHSGRALLPGMEAGDVRVPDELTGAERANGVQSDPCFERHRDPLPTVPMPVASKHDDANPRNGKHTRATENDGF